MSRKKLGELYRFEPLDKSHDRNVFDCGNERLNTYFRQQALQDQKRKVSTVFVAVEKKTRAVHGFYTLSAAHVKLNDFPASTAKKLSKYKDQPAIRLGRLAVHKDVQGKKLGTFLLYEAMLKIIAQQIGWVAFIVDAKGDNARNFYLGHDFLSFKDDPLHLYLMRYTIEKLLR